MITPVFILSVLLILFILFRKGYFSLVDPLLMICFQHIYFFGFRYTPDNTFKYVDFLIAISFFVFVVSYLIISRYFKYKNFFVYDAEYSESRASRVINYSLVFVLLFALYSFFLNYHAYGGDLERQFFRFYIIKPVNEISGFWYQLETTFARIAIISIFVISFFGRRVLDEIKLYSAFFLFSLVVLPTGTRGYLLSAFLGIIFAKILNSKSIRSLIKPSLIVLCFIVFMSFSVLSAIRGVDMTGVTVVEAYQQYEKVKSADSLDVLTTTTNAIGNYGDKYEYLNFHTLYSIAVNLMPRAIWSSKPDGVGRIIAYNEGFPKDTNVSFAAGYMGEGWINFGLLGMFLFSIFFGGLSGIFSVLFYKSIEAKSLKGIAYCLSFYAASTGFVRGDMLSAWAQSIYPIVLMFLMFLVFRIRVKA